MLEETFDKGGNQTSFKDALTHTWNFTVNSIDALTQVKDPLLHEVN